MSVHTHTKFTILFIKRNILLQRLLKYRRHIADNNFTRSFKNMTQCTQSEMIRFYSVNIQLLKNATYKCLLCTGLQFCIVLLAWALFKNLSFAWISCKAFPSHRIVSKFQRWSQTPKLIEICSIVSEINLRGTFAPTRTSVLHFVQATRRSSLRSTCYFRQFSFEDHISHTSTCTHHPCTPRIIHKLWACRMWRCTSGLISRFTQFVITHARTRTKKCYIMSHNEIAWREAEWLQHLNVNILRAFQRQFLPNTLKVSVYYRSKVFITRTLS